jgi:hypothetical protein
VEAERERVKAADLHEVRMQEEAISNRLEVQRVREELQAEYGAELAALQKRHVGLLRDREDECGSEAVGLQRALTEGQEENRELHRQLVKSEAIREVLKQDAENMRQERQLLRDRAHVLELEVIEHGKTKFEARVRAEKDRMEGAFQAAFEEVRAEVGLKGEESRVQAAQLHRTEGELGEARDALRGAQAEARGLNERCQEAVERGETEAGVALKAALALQQESLQREYLGVIQDQVQALVDLIQNQTLVPGGNTYGEQLYSILLCVYSSMPLLTYSPIHYICIYMCI